MTYKTLTSNLLQRVVGTTAGKTFRSMIQRMNEMYKLPVNTEPTLDNLPKPNGEPQTAVERILGFLKTLNDEVHEGYEILVKLAMLQKVTAYKDKESGAFYAADVEELLCDTVGQYGTNLLADSIEKLRLYAELCFSDLHEAEKDVLVDIADWTGDIVVYCRSEAMKFGINLESVLEAIMGSNFTKLPSDGIPKHDENGKFLKDMTNFVPPENAIKSLLFGLAADHGSDEEIALRGTSAHPNSAANLLRPDTE